MLIVYLFPVFAHILMPEILISKMGEIIVIRNKHDMLKNIYGHIFNKTTFLSSVKAYLFIYLL